MPPIRRLAAVLAFALLLAVARAQVPQLINYQGRVVVDGVNFDSTAAGHAGVFRFALVNADGSQTYWSNDGTSAAGSEPVAGVALAVRSGLYAVALGDSAPPLGMVPVSHTVFANADVRLRVWFDDGAHGSQLLTPDQRLAAVGYALVARSVADGAVTAEKIAPGAVTGGHLAVGSVDGTKIAVGAVQSAHLAAGAVGNAQLANAAVTVTAGEGLDGGGTVALGGAITLNNTGVTGLTAGGGITLSGSTGTITLGSTATALGTPGTLVVRDANGGFAAGTITGNLLGNAATATSAGSALTAATAGSALTATTAGSALTALTANDFSGLLAGDVTGPQGAVVVLKIGGVTPSSASVPGAVVRRDASGNFSAGTVSASAFSGSGAGLTGVPGTLPWQTVAGTAQLAEPNTGYLATAAAVVTITLPATAAAGDLVRVTGAGAGGWALVPGAGQSIAGFGAGLGPVGVPGADATVQYVGAGQWQPLNESQLAAGTVGSAQLAAGAVDSTKLVVGAVQSAHIAAGAVGNAQLANAAVTVTAGEGLDGGGTVALGGAITLNNTGVTGLAAGGGITLSGSTGAITLGSNATALSTPGTLVVRATNGDFAAGTITGNLLGNAATATSAGSALTAATAGSALTATTAGSALTALMANDFSGLLAGDVTGPQGVTSVGFVGGVSAANVAAGALLANAATALASPGTLVLRDLNGDFSAGTITGNLLGNAATATTAVSFSGPLAGDVGGTQGAVVVLKIGGVTPSSASVPGAVVRRDASGNFSAGTVSASAFSGSGAGLTGVPGTLPWQTITGTAQLAEPNTGYLATAAAVVTITLPATAAAGDLVRVTGAGAGGWALVPGAGQSIAGFGAGLGPVGAQGAGGAVQYLGGDQWQPLNESQLAAGAVGSAQLAAGAVDSTKLAAGAVQNASIAAGTIANAKLANPTFSVNAGAGLAGGGSAALGGALALSIPNGGIGNAQLANPGFTLTTGAGLAGGGPVVLGGALSLSIPVAGITSAQLAPNAVTGANITAGAVNGTHLAPGAAMANITNSGQDLAAIAALVSNPSAAQWLGASALPTFMGERLLNTGTGANKPALVLDRGIAPKGRVAFQKTNEEAGWSGLVLSINADWSDQTGYAYDDGGRSQSIMQLEYEFLTPFGFRQNEFNWTSSGRRIWAHHCRVDDNTKAGVAFLASLLVSVPANDTTGAPAFQVEGYKAAGDAVTAILQNDNPTAAASSQLILRGISTGMNHFPVAWSLATDRAGTGTNNFAISDSVAGVDRLFIDPAGKVGINNVTPQAQLDVTGAVHVSGAVQAGGPVDATGFTVNGAPLQSVKHSLEFGGGQVQGMGNSRGSGFLWRSPVILSAAFSPFGGSSEDRGPFVPQPKAEYSYGCIVLPRTWANGIQIRVRTWYCLKPGDTADAAPGNVVLLMQGVWGRSTPLTSISQPVASWDLTSAGSGLQPLAFAGGIDGELIFDERTYTIPAGADLTSRQIRFGRFGGSAGDTEPKDIYFFGITVEQL